MHTVSLGAPRIFKLQNKQTKETIKLELEPGSLFILGWDTNGEWKHAIPRTAKSVGTRISLTYRAIQTKTDASGKVF